MTSAQLEIVIADADAAWHGADGTPMMNPNCPTEVAHYRATLEVAWQLAVLNENLGQIINTRDARLRVMVEPGDWPLRVNQTGGR